MCNKCSRKGHLAKVCKGDSANASKTSEIKKLILPGESPDRSLEHERDFFSIKQNFVANSHNESENVNNDRINNKMENELSAATSNNIMKAGELQGDWNSELYNLASSTGTMPMYVMININGKDLNFEIDTGTFATVISEKIYIDFFKGLYITKTSKDLRAYGGQALVLLGELLNLKVTFRNVNKILKCFVLPGTGPPLMGREWLTQFGALPLIIPKSDTNDINRIAENLRDYLTQEYQILFSDTPGLYNESKTQIHLKENTRPVALKCRHIAHASRPMVEKEIDRLVSLGHLEPVDVAEWTTPIVPVLKGNGTERNFRMFWVRGLGV